MVKRSIGALACALAITLAMQAAPASAQTSWLSNLWITEVRTTQDRGVAFIRGNTDNAHIFEATYYYEFLAYDGRWIPSENTVTARDGVTRLTGFFPGLAVGITVRVRANHWVQAYTSH
jgi:hypothetical protein